MDITYIQQLGVNFIDIGISKHEDIDASRKFIILNGISLIGVITLIFMGSVSYFNQCFDVFIFDYIIAIILVLNIINLKKTGNYPAASVTGVSSLGILLFYLLITGGDNNTGHLFFFTFPLFAYFLLGSKNGTFATLILFLPSLVFLIVNPLLPELAVYPRDLTFRFVGAFLVVTAFSCILERTRENTYKKLVSKNRELSNAINELKRVEHNLREAGERLEMRVKERTKELSRTNHELLREIEERRHAEEDRQRIAIQLIQAQKMEAVGTLAGGVAHDLNNILAGIVGYPELILMELPDDSPLRKSILTIKKTGEKASAIVEDLLTLSRRGVSIKEPIVINEIIKDYLESPEFKKLKLYHPRITIGTLLEKEIVYMEGSPVHLFKAIMNLVSNAAEAISNDGKIRISTQIRWIDEKDKLNIELPKGKYILLQVSDNGEGIREEDLERIFEPFFTKKKMGKSGTGLGMAVVWGTVQDHDGYIEVQSKVGEGTTFSLYFPVSDKKRVEKSKILSMDKLMGKGESILIVDDVEEQREVSSAMLETLGYRVESVSSGEKAMEYLQSHDFDLILLDMIMDPGMDGLETLVELKKIKADQKAIITSGYSETDRVRECKNLGAGAYVKKPFTLDEIGQAIREVLSDNRIS